MRKYADLCPPESAPELIPFGYPERLNAVEAVLEEACAAGWTERPAYYQGQRTISFGEVRSEVHRFAAALRALGVVEGDVVILRIPDSFDLVASILAVQAIGAVAMPTYIQLRAGDLIYRADDAGARLLISSADLLDEAAPVAARGARTEVVALTRDPLGRFRSFADCLPKGPVEPVYADTDAEALCLLLYTSGSTGEPKGTCHCHSDMLAIADSYWRRAVAPRPDDIVGGPPSIAFALGFGLFVYFPLRLGHAAVLEADKSPRKALELIAAHRITIFAGVVSYYNALAPLIRDAAPDLSSLRHPMTGGEPLAGEVERAWLEATGLPLEQFIGTTEMLHCFLTSTRSDGPPGAATLGREVPGYEVAVLDPDTLKPVPDGAPGLLAARGPTGTVYWNKPDQQAKTVRDGWNVFQDVVVRDARGDFRYVARHDEMIVSAGYNISPVQVESVLMQHAAVAECACVPAPDPTGRRGAVVKAFVVPAHGVAGDDALAADLQNHVKRLAPPYMYPRAVAFETELPKTINGKIRRSELRRKANDPGA